MKINLYGDIVSDEEVWLYELFGIPCCNPKIVRDALLQLPDDDTLTVEINSPGGSVWAGFEIFGLLQTLGERTEAHIISLAASAATTVMCGCARVLASPVAQIMVHQPSVTVGFETFNNEGARQLKNFLDSIKASIINSYVVKSAGKASRRKLEQLVDNSTWMPVQDAMDLGLVDGLLDVGEDMAAAVSAGGAIGVSNSAAATSSRTLLERYEAAVRAGTMAEVPGHPVGRETPQSEGEREQRANDAADAAEYAIQRTAADFADGPEQTTYAILQPEEDPVITENREIAENLCFQWKLQAAIDLERARAVG